MKVDNSLNAYTIKEGTKWIGNGALYGSRGLTSITIPDSVTSIGEDAFADCTSLTSITIGNSVTSIGRSAFSGCSSLNEIICRATTAPSITNRSTFTGVKSYGKLWYPSGSDYSSWLKNGDFFRWTGKEIQH